MVDTDAIQLGFMPGKGTVSTTTAEEVPGEKEETLFCLCGSGESI